MSSEQNEQSAAVEDSVDAARQLAAEDDTSSYETVLHTSTKTGKTVRYEVRPPTVQEIDDARAASMRVRVDAKNKVVKDGRGNPLMDLNVAEWVTRQLICAVYARNAEGNMARVFTLQDREMLLSRRGGKGSLISKLTEAVLRATGGISVKEEMGNSDASPSDASA